MKRLLPLLAAWAISSSAVMACSTPVHRYAMYNWTPSTYWICYFFDGEEAASDTAVNRELEKMSGEESLVNIVYRPVNIQEPGRLDGVPPAVKKALDERRDGKLPVHMVLSPRGALLHVGTLATTDLAALTRSSVRDRMADLLQNGRHGALIFLPGADEKRNARARSELQKAIGLAAGRVAVMDPSPAVKLPGETTDSGGTTAADTFDLEFLEVSRKDPGETWLVRQLLAVEELDEEERGLPMVFGIYGRGRALEPYLGDGIEADNLVDMIGFMNGPCSCEVKDRNPGVDLLVTRDWEAAARALAKSVGRETGNEKLLEELGFAYEEIAVDSVEHHGEDEAPEPEVADGTLESADRESTDSGTGEAAVTAAPTSTGSGADPTVTGFVLLPILGGIALLLLIATVVVVRRLA